MLDYIKSLPFYVLPHHLLSWVVFHLARIHWRPLKDFMLRVYLALHDVNMEEAEEYNPFAYPSLNAFFTRRLKPEVRPVDSDNRSLVSPVDGTVSQAGIIRDGQIFQAKGHEYSLKTLVGGDTDMARPFVNGNFATLYLSPRDYHRIHMPVDGRLTDMIYIPGRLFSVAPHTVNTIPGLFARNERLVCRFETPAGVMIMVLVGAVNVSAIDTVWAGSITPPGKWHIQRTHYDDGVDIQLKKGVEMGRFNLGSTVILLMEQDVRMDAILSAGSGVRMGEKIAGF